MSRRAAIVFLFAATLAAQSAPTPIDPVVRPGPRMLAGGGKLPPEIFARFLTLAGGANAKVVLIPTASETADDDQQNTDTLRLYRERLPGAEVTLLHTRDRTVADDEAFCVPLARATGVWITGGAQDRLASAYLGTRVERELMALLARGGVIGGTSAGTAIQTRTMIQEGKDPPVMATGFDFVPGAISDQHFLKRQRLPRLLQALVMRPGHFGLGVDEGTAAVIRGDELEVIGASKVVLVLPAFHGHDQVVTPIAAGERRIGLWQWRLAAQVRAEWPLPTAAAEPRVAAGTLLLGAAADLPRFVELAGGKGARVVVVPTGWQFSDVPTLEQLLRQSGAGDIQTFNPPNARTLAPELLSVFTDATGVMIDNGSGHEHDAALAFPDDRAREALRGVLSRGGVVFGCESLGELAPGGAFATADGADPNLAYRRGLALLPGCVIEQAPASLAPTDAPPWAGLRFWIQRLPHLTGIGIRGAAVVRGSELEVLGGSSVTVLPARGDGKDASPPIQLEAGERYDLVTGARR